MMEEILFLKREGYSLQEVEAHYKGLNGKAPSRPTLRKYYNMESVPEDAGAVYAKEKVFDTEPFRSVIIETMTRCDGGFCISSLYDMLVERFVESGEYAKLPGNEQTLRNYAKYLTGSGAVELDAKKGRIYEHVFDTPPGEQLLLDFGELRLPGGKQVHFLCLLLRYSRMICVYAQDHKYNGEEACRDIYRAFRSLQGRPRVLVIDQDSVFVVSETYGEVVETRVFKDFCAEQELKLWVCNKADPESKGGVENLVGFVKKNYFSARRISCVEDVWETLPAWVARKNRRIHQATYRVPQEVFESIEQPSLSRLLPSVHENMPSSYKRVSVSSTPYILYKASHYSVPREYCFKTICYKVTGEKLHVYDEKRRFLCSHTLSGRKGAYIQLEEHKKEPSTKWKEVAERLRAKWNCADFQHFINGFKRENPRHLPEQLLAVEGFLNSESPGKDLVALVLSRCCAGYRYRFNQFKEVYFLARGEFAAPETAAVPGVQSQSLAAYQRAFEGRCGV